MANVQVFMAKVNTTRCRLQVSMAKVNTTRCCLQMSMAKVDTTWCHFQVSVANSLRGFASSRKGCKALMDHNSP
jgi:hypothetical protein